MLDGLYFVKFAAATKDFGEGLVAIKDGRINGGDRGYVYQGFAASADRQISGDLTIRRWNKSVASVFGSIDLFRLDLSGEQTADSGLLRKWKRQESAWPENKITATFIAELY